MIIEYTQSHYVSEEHKIEIEDTKNVFLKGKNPYNNLSTYFGIWTNEKYLIIVTISNRSISYNYSLDRNGYTECDIRNFLRCNSDVKKISREQFKRELDSIVSKFKI